MSEKTGLGPRMKWHVLSSISTHDALLKKLLEARDVRNTEKFLNPPHPLLYMKDFSAAFKKSMLAAKNVIFSAIESNMPVIIHGDYDADGICATAILYNCIHKELGYTNCFSFIPSRFEHGYGLSEESIKEVLKPFSRDEKILFITVDSGITSIDVVERIKKLGHKIVITDHHQKPDELPNADVIVWNDLAVGASLAWLLARVLGSVDETSIGLAALATVTDVQPLMDFNRSIVRMGIKALVEHPPLGLKMLIDASGIFSDKELTTYELGWVIGPRINASGRMESANDSLKLLISDDEVELEKLARKLNMINIERQEKTAEMFALADDVKTKDRKFVLTASEQFHEGIIGLVAGKIVRKYYLPCIVIALNDGVGKGSVRSIPGIDIIKVLREFSSLFIDLGGHPMAAGFTIEKKNMPKLEARLKKYFDEYLYDSDLYIPEITVDAKIPLGLIGEEFLAQIEVLKPYGTGNEEPVFLSENVELASKRHVGKESAHVSMKFLYEDKFYSGILFNAENKVENISSGDKIDIVYSVRRSTYSGKEELVLKDISISV